MIVTRRSGIALVLRGLGLAVGVCAASFATALAAFEVPLQVAQPLETEEGIFVSSVSYVKYLGSPIPGYAVSYVCKESCVIDELGNRVNRNAANLLGITTGFDPFHASGQLFGDTLRVFIDLSGVTGQKTPHDWPLKAVVEATVECVLTTAYESRTGLDLKSHALVKARYVDLRVLGSSAYASLGSVYSFEKLGTLPRKWQFD